MSRNKQTVDTYLDGFRKTRDNGDVMRMSMAEVFVMRDEDDYR